MHKTHRAYIIPTLSAAIYISYQVIFLLVNVK